MYDSRTYSTQKQAADLSRELAAYEREFQRRGCPLSPAKSRRKPPEDCFAALIGLVNPVLHPLGRQQVVEILHVARNHSEAGGASHRRDDNVCITLLGFHTLA